MGIHFKLKDFCYPLSIVRLKKTFDRNQWLSQEELEKYQTERLRCIITQAYQNVPYYQSLFRENDVTPHDIASLHDLRKLPFLTRNILRTNFQSLLARNAQRYNPVALSSSGTTGNRVAFYADKPSNVLEFVYYWRLWGWAGYQLGDPVAELCAEFFTLAAEKSARLHCYSFLTRRLLINSLFISRKYLDDFIALFRHYQPLFLKGLPSNLYMLALLLRERPHHGISFRGIFSQGENLLPSQRECIENVFSSKVYDSYGHMERTAAISQCPHGSYHIHPDYGFVEFEEPNMLLSNNGNDSPQVKEIVGTSLHNLSMPLIRYRTGDLVKLSSSSSEPCRCRRNFPTVERIIGRDTDVIITPDGRAITAMYTIFDRVPGVTMGQIIQDRLDRLIVKIARRNGAANSITGEIRENIELFVGKGMQIHIEETKAEVLREASMGKFKVVVSEIPREKILDLN